jgi:chromosome segregation ATPase
VNSQYDPGRLDRVEATLEKIAESQKQFDERIARLTDCHEALAQSAEIFRHDMEDLRREMNSKFAQTLEFINQLAHVADARERRLDLESGRQ